MVLDTTVDALAQAVLQHLAWQIASDENHPGGARFTFFPGAAGICTHHHVYTLKDDALAIALYVQHTLVAHHLWPVDLRDGAEEILQQINIQRAIFTKYAWGSIPRCDRLGF